MVHVSGARSRIQSSASLSHLRTINAGVDESDVLGAGFRVLRTAWCVVRGAWCVVRTAYCGFGLGLALLSQIASTCPQQSDRQASVAGSGATYTDMCAVVKLASD
jgi:hypothetical protein